MKRLLQLTLASLTILIGITFAPMAGAINVFDGACDSGSTTPAGGTPATNTQPAGGGGSSSLCGAAKQDEAPAIIKNVINLALVILGMVAVIMIIIGGIRYTTSNGDSSATKGAKDTILYAVVGLVVAIMAYAIVNFVLAALGGK